MSSAAGLPPSCQVVALADSLPDHLGSGKSQLKPDRRRPSPSSHTCVLQIIEDLKEECGKHGTVVKVVVPRPSPPSIAPQVFGTKGYGKVNCCPLPDCHLPDCAASTCLLQHPPLPAPLQAFAQFDTLQSAQKAKLAIHGRLFDGQTVNIVYISGATFNAATYGL